MAFESVLSFMTTAVVALLFTMSLTLYFRWRTRNYFTISLIFGISFLIHLVYSILASTEARSVLGHLLKINVMFLQPGLTLVLIGVYYFFHSKKKPKLVIPIGITCLQGLICLISIFVKSNVFHAVLPLITVAFFIYFSVSLLPDFAKRIRFLVLMGIAGIGSASLIISLLSENSIWNRSFWVFEFGYYFGVFLILFDRVVELMQSVSISNVIDGLTGLYTKQYFISKVNESMQNDDHSAVLFLDIDNFKNLNDTQGHAVGDEILRIAGKILREVSEEIGYAGRYGGEEMVVLLTDPESDAAIVAERIRDRIERESQDIYPVTASIGYKVYSSELPGPGEYIKQADIAMYAAKTSGKNRVVDYDKRHLIEVKESEAYEVEIQLDPEQEIQGESPAIPESAEHADTEAEQQPFEDLSEALPHAAIEVALTDQVESESNSSKDEELVSESGDLVLQIKEEVRAPKRRNPFAKS